MRFYILLTAKLDIQFGHCVCVGRGGLRGRVSDFRRRDLLPFRNLSHFVHPTLPLSFGRDTKHRWSLLYGVYARGNKRSHTGGKCVTCYGHLSWATAEASVTRLNE